MRPKSLIRQIGGEGFELNLPFGNRQLPYFIVAAAAEGLQIIELAFLRSQVSQ